MAKQAELLKEITKYGTGGYLLGDVLYYSSDRTVAQYKLMRRYPMCWLGLQFIKLGLENVPYTIECDNEQVARITDKVLEKIWKKLIREATECIDYGFKVFEIRYKTGDISYSDEQDEAKTFSGILFKQPKGLDGENIQILIEKDGSLRGFRQNNGFDSVDVLVEDRKCLLFTHNLESGQYYGMSALEPAYPFWYDANLNRRFHMRWLERKGTGFFKGYYPVGTTQTENGEKDNQDIMLEILDNMIEGNVIAIPSGRDEHGQLQWDVAFLNDEDKTDPFITRAKYIDEMILKALVIPEKALTQGEIGARASIEAFQDMFLQRKQAVLDEIVSTINNYLIPHFVELNFGKDIDVQIIPGQLGDYSIELSNKIVQKLIEMDKVKVERQWLVEKTGIPLKYKDEIMAEEKEPIIIEQKEQDVEELSECCENEKPRRVAIFADEEEYKPFRPENELERKYNLTSWNGFFEEAKQTFIRNIEKELQFQIDRIKRYLIKNLSASNYMQIVNEIEIKKSPIRKIFSNYLYSVYEYVMKNFQNAEWRFGEVDTFIGFRIDVVADKIVKDLETSIKLQISNDMAAGKSQIEILDRIGNTTLQSFLTSRMPVVAETEIGFILNKSVDFYIKQNLQAFKKGLIDEMKKIERVRYSAILDNKVCPFCHKMDGTVVEVGSAVYYRFSPPIHYNCRCVWLPITAEEVANPRYEYTDLTKNEKGQNVGVDDIMRKLGDDSKLRTFCECGG